MAFEELKQRHAAMWGAGRFELVATTLAEMHDAVVSALTGGHGTDWLDVGCGTGELASRAAATGARVTGADLAPALVETARRQAADAGVDATFVVGDAEALPFHDTSFDVVSSSVGAIFAPDHARVASELARVCRPGGRLGLTAWTTGGEIDEFFALIGSYAPPPPPDAGNAMQWGDRDYCEQLLGEAFDLSFEDRNTPWGDESPEAMWDLLVTGFGPIKSLVGAIGPERAEQFRDEMLALLRDVSTDGATMLDRPYLLVTGVRR